jgi:PAS domain S-box-containing protein
MSKACILIVEDEGIIAEDLQMSLREGGYEVTSIVSTGRAAIMEAEARRPDLVLMDIVLQGPIDGIEAADLIRTKLDVPIIYLTAYSDEKMLERAKVTGPFGYLLKPFRDRELHGTIEMALFKHKLEKQLREREQWLSVTLQSIGDAVIAADKSGLVTLMNPLARKLTGWSQEAAKDKALHEVFNVVEERTGAPVAGLRDGPKVQAWIGGLSDHPMILKSGDGTTTAIEGSTAPIRGANGVTVGTVVVFRDITERRRAEERLRLLSEAVEQASEGIAVVDLDGNMLFVNQAFAGMHGSSPGELAGKNLSVFHNAEQLPSVEEANREILDTGVFSGEIWHTRRDGSVFPGLMHNSILRDGEGNSVGIIGTLRDITANKETEEELRRSHEELEAYSSKLEAMVRDRTRDLEDSELNLKKYSESLEKTNEALKIIIQGIEEQKKEVEKKVFHNLNLTVTPILDQLKSQDLSDTVTFLLQSLEFNLTNMFSSFGANLAKDGHTMTPREIRICEMIRSGLSSKQMAKVLGISPQTVLVHRKNIRKKLGLAKSKKNLASFLKVNF